MQDSQPIVDLRFVSVLCTTHGSICSGVFSKVGDGRPAVIKNYDSTCKIELANGDCDMMFEKSTGLTDPNIHLLVTEVGEPNFFTKTICVGRHTPRADADAMIKVMTS